MLKCAKCGKYVGLRWLIASYAFPLKCDSCNMYSVRKYIYLRALFFAFALLFPFVFLAIYSGKIDYHFIGAFSLSIFILAIYFDFKNGKLIEMSIEEFDRKNSYLNKKKVIALIVFIVFLIVSNQWK